MKHKAHTLFVRSAVAVLLLTIVLLFNGCSEQPTQYIATLEGRHYNTAARTAINMMNTLYNHVDEAGVYLERSALTDDYITLLPPGWNQTVALDPSNNLPYELFYHVYLDKRYSSLRFDPRPQAIAVRQPSSLNFTYIEVSSYIDNQNQDFYGLNDKYYHLSCEYADNRSNPNFITGWMDLQQLIGVERTIEIPGAGSITYTEYLPISWQFKVNRYALSRNDLASDLSIFGTMGISDHVGKNHNVPVTGDAKINSNGSGKIDLYMNGDLVAKINFKSRGFSFEGSFTLKDDNFTREIKI